MNIRQRTLRFNQWIKANPVRIISFIVATILLIGLFLTVTAIWQPYRLRLPPKLNRIVSDAPDGRNFQEKKWIHGVDSIDMVHYAEAKYSGMEIDVVFDESHGFLDVRHPPAESIGLPLEVMIGEIKNPRSHFYMLDFKNLTISNKRAALDELCRIASFYGIAANIIVESSNASVLAEFSRAHFYTSYYLPNINLDRMMAKELEAYINNICDDLASTTINAISANYHQYALIKKYFDGYDLIMWSFMDNPLALKMIEHKLLKDPRIKIILIEDKPQLER